MPLTQLAPPYPIFTDKNGDPLDAGFLYFGVADQNPETNPITVYFDNALTQPAAQPIRTINGYPSRNGSPAAIYTDEYFSVTVRNKKNELVIYAPSGYGVTPGTSASFTDQMIYNEGSVGAVDRVLTSRLQDYISAKDFGAIGDGVADDTAAIQAAADAANARGAPLHVGEGTYLLSSMVTLYAGLSGAGVGRTIFQAVNDGTQRQEIIRISGAGIYEGFTVDGAVSADPPSWNSSNFDAFTGWLGVYVRTDNVTIRNARAQNTWQSGFAGWEVENVILESCETDRSRGNFGDGFFFYYSAKNITHINCRAYDFTRIGFVFDGDGSNPSDGCVYQNCHAEYGHDRSSLYGGGEFNSGFWVENCRRVSFDACSARNTGERGFTVAVGSGSTFFEEAATFTFNSCFAENVSPPVASSEISNGFILEALDSPYRGNISLAGCTAKNVSGSGFVAATSADVTLTRCAYFKDGGGSQSRAISAQTNATISVNDFYEEWTNKPAGYLNNSIDTASIGSFSGAVVAPLAIYIDNYRTHDGGYAIIKQRLSGVLAGARLVVKNSHIALGEVYSTDGAVFENCKISAPIGSVLIITTGETLFSNCMITLSESFLVGWLQDVKQVLLQGCRIERTGAFRLISFRFGTAGAANRVWRISDAVFEGNLETDGTFLQQNADAPIFDTPGQDLFFNGCVFVNTGGATSNEAIRIEATALNAAKAYFSGCWKSPTISTMAKAGGFFAAGSTVNNL